MHRSPSKARGQSIDSLISYASCTKSSNLEASYNFAGNLVLTVGVCQFVFVNPQFALTQDCSATYTTGTFGPRSASLANVSARSIYYYLNGNSVPMPANLWRGVHLRTAEGVARKLLRNEWQSSCLLAFHTGAVLSILFILTPPERTKMSSTQTRWDPRTLRTVRMQVLRNAFYVLESSMPRFAPHSDFDRWRSFSRTNQCGMSPPSGY
jgi:hypothetical protein